MALHLKSISAALISFLILHSVVQGQSEHGSGNDAAAGIARRSRLVSTAAGFLINQARLLRDPKLRKETVDAISNPATCIRHRAGLTGEAKIRILQMLAREDLLVTSDASTFPGGPTAGVFPAIPSDGTDCPRLPQSFATAPGGSFHGHHSYPGGLAIHELNNEVASLHLAAQYANVYGLGAENVAPTIHSDAIENSSKLHNAGIDLDLIVGAPLWHDWAKSIVFQWNTDGSEFPELDFGGNGRTDNFGLPGDSRTGAHHILGIAEAMKRSLDAKFVITQASAHSAPSPGNEYKVVNWLRAAAIVAQIDPVMGGYLVRDKKGNFRLPPLGELGQIDLTATSPSQSNILVEYMLHNLSDADYVFSQPALTMVETLLAQLAPEFGFDPQDIASYNLRYRNPALSCLTAERLQIIYAGQGLTGIRKQLQILRKSRII